MQVRYKNAPASDDVEAALDIILDSVEDTRSFVGKAADDHLSFFSNQMFDLTGEGIQELEEPYLEFEITNFELQFLKTLERLLGQVERVVLPTKNLPDIETEEEYHEIIARLPFELKSIDKNAPIRPQIEERLAKEAERLEVRIGQKMDERRQQAVGVKNYIWRTQDDTKVRASHLANDDKIFSWKNPPETGHPGDDFGCRCLAEPTLIGVGEPTDAIEEVYPELLIPILAARSRIVAGFRRIINKVRGGDKGLSEDKATEHGIKRALERNITSKEAEEAIRTAKETGSVVRKTGRFGTEQIHYTGSNGVTVVIETSGRNAGKIITIWRH